MRNRNVDLTALNHAPAYDPDRQHYVVRKQEATGMIQLSGVEAKPPSSRPTLFQRLLGRKAG